MKESIRSDILQKVVWKPPLYQSEEIDPRDSAELQGKCFVFRLDPSYLESIILSHFGNKKMQSGRQK